jgi:hypothetical protein
MTVASDGEDGSHEPQRLQREYFHFVLTLKRKKKIIIINKVESLFVTSILLSKKRKWVNRGVLIFHYDDESICTHTTYNTRPLYIGCQRTGRLSTIARVRRYGNSPVVQLPLRQFHLAFRETLLLSQSTKTKRIISQNFKPKICFTF